MPGLNDQALKHSSKGYSIEWKEYMTKEKLVDKIKELLKVDIDLGFLLALEKGSLESLIACIRDRVDHVREWKRESAGTWPEAEVK